MLDARIRPLIDPALDRLAARLHRLRLSANTVTVLGFALGVLAMLLVSRQLYLPALACLLLNRVADGLDGAVARRTEVTDLGGFLDIVLDFIIYSGIVFAFALADPPANALAAAFLIFSFVGTGGTFLAFAAMAARRRIETTERGLKSLYYLGGLTEGAETILILVLFCLLPGWFPALAVLFGALCWVTTLARVLTAVRLLR
jgi:phosphatidylglycerophosphate synthase